ncbi:hypothetical protein F5B22DRAFT_152668 [Xylaria bambusicola]|uniref:uncharacterized protein n=1 Tax=Xylaria bambusicola TaxID=326684 RepID=UPI002007643A|nr:uncharacterized protein F5B22DRAFT_152668 [Xylaria bambusicola]KAI0526312.1 hypothetical protein F5B22DRAFT_152668 [Xylaria bambusicola]
MARYPCLLSLLPGFLACCKATVEGPCMRNAFLPNSTPHTFDCLHGYLLYLLGGLPTSGTMYVDRMLDNWTLTYYLRLLNCTLQTVLVVMKLLISFLFIEPITQGCVCFGNANFGFYVVRRPNQVGRGECECETWLT